MRKLFVDTSGWLALVNRSDLLHESATKIYNEYLDDGWHVVTHAGILLETGNSLSRIKLRHLAIKLKNRIDSSAIIESISLSDQLIEDGWRLYSQRLDKEWGVVDCVSFLLMEKHGLTQALTADHHFTQAGFNKLL